MRLSRPHGTDTAQPRLRWRAAALRVLTAGVVLAGIGLVVIQGQEAESNPGPIPDDRPASLTTNNNTPFPRSGLITGARWTTRRYDPPKPQYGDILPTTLSSDGNMYTMINDGGLGPYRNPPEWRNAVVRVDGTPPKPRFTLMGKGQPLGYLYSDGLTSVGGTLYATRVRDWDWLHFQPFLGLVDVAYSRDQGGHWTYGGKSFPNRAGNLSFVQEGKDATNPDGYVYAISSEREFNASHLYVGRTRPSAPDITTPSHWEWLDGMAGGQPRWRRDLARARGALTWRNHITYPQMTYVAGLKRYLLSFSYSYRNDKDPDTYTAGAELVVLESEHPWGPFKFVFREPYWGPSNGYGGSFPVKWQSANGQDLWMIWAANWNVDAGRCAAGLRCSGKYGFNMRRVHLSVKR
jgi:hypothetical protein